MSIQAVIFDRDNTLVHFDAIAIAALERCIATAAPMAPPGAAVEHWANWSGPWPRTPDEEAEFWRIFWADFAGRNALPKAALAELNEIGAFYHTCFKAFPDSLECLALLRARGLRLAILSNFELPSIQSTLHNAGLDSSLFDVLLSSAAIGFRKPDPRAYLVAATSLGLPASDCAFVDDLPENVAVAHHLGMRAFLLDRHRVFATHPHSINSLGELSILLEPVRMAHLTAQL